MTQNATTTLINHSASLAAGGGIMSVIGQNSSAITVIIVALTGAASVWINRKNAKTNEENEKTNKRNADANEKRNEINRRDIIDSLIADMESSDLTSREKEKFRNNLRKK